MDRDQQVLEEGAFKLEKMLADCIVKLIAVWISVWHGGSEDWTWLSVLHACSQIRIADETILHALMGKPVSVPFKALLVQQLDRWDMRPQLLLKGTIESEDVVKGSVCFFDASRGKRSNVAQRKVHSQKSNLVVAYVHPVGAETCFGYRLAPAAPLHEVRDRTWAGLEEVVLPPVLNVCLERIDVMFEARIGGVQLISSCEEGASRGQGECSSAPDQGGRLWIVFSLGAESNDIFKVGAAVAVNAEHAGKGEQEASL